ncbi:hypothetical protein VTN49DRAFT_7290 [Thermomyces lanuginosus]|uniref:uncharacterized protein n=1 Tax=Thermomyces lanuginosus TaxID=5541 RepID=UPI00374281C0
MSFKNVYYFLFRYLVREGRGPGNYIVSDLQEMNRRPRSCRFILEPYSEPNIDTVVSSSNGNFNQCTS